MMAQRRASRGKTWYPKVVEVKVVVVMMTGVLCYAYYAVL